MRSPEQLERKRLKDILWRKKHPRYLSKWRKEHPDYHKNWQKNSRALPSKQNKARILKVSVRVNLMEWYCRPI